MNNKVIAEPLMVKIVRLITGLVFVFSSIVKGIDPVGTDYRIIDYLEVYGWYWLVDFSLVLSFILISVEFLLGVALLFKLRIRLAALGLLLMMAFFTIVTYFDARYNLVPDCGCFGDAVKLTNWETFYKNILLMIFALVIFVKRNNIARDMQKWLQVAMLIIFLAVFDWFIFYNYNNLPVVDFRDWRIGNNMKSSGRETVKTYLVYKNKDTGETKEYLSPDYPWNDSIWMSEWEFVSQRIDDSQLVLKHGLIIEDENGNNFTEDIIENPGYQIILAAWDLDNSSGKGMIDAAELFGELLESDVNITLLTSSTEDIISKYKELYTINYDVYFADDIELKAMIRSNPGMLLLKNGIVVSKWHYNNFPSVEEVNEKISK